MLKKFDGNKILISIFAVLLSCFPGFGLRAKTTSPVTHEELLETIQRQSFQFFLSERNSNTGLIRDRANNFRKHQETTPASIAASGFALTAYGVGAKRNWIDYGSAQKMTLEILDFVLNHVEEKNGFFYHFLDPETGKRANKSEVSPIDTALFLAGALFAAEFYEDVRIRDLAIKIYERVDWPWMLNGGEMFSLSWSPESGFNKRRWDHYDESMILYLLAIGSPSHPVPASSWREISRPVGSYQGHRMIQMPPLFTHQYSHIWVDFRNINDGFADYFKNSVQASLANRAFAMDEARKFKSYGANSWGLTASDGPFGYKAYGAPPGWAFHDGTVSPSGCGSSIVFTPKESLDCLNYLYNNLKENIWGEYGFSSAFNLDKNWFSEYAIAIDQGDLILMIENYRSELIWKTMNRSSYLQTALKAVGFKEGSVDLPWPNPPTHKAAYLHAGIQIDGYLKDWPRTDLIKLDKSNKENGSIKDAADLSGEIRFGWNEYALFFAAEVTDNNLVAKKSGKNIWKDDCFELFVDPDGDGLFWNDSKDFQIGFTPNEKNDQVKVWSWFQNDSEESRNQIAAKGFVHGGGYLIEGAVKWNYLGMRPKVGDMIKAGPAIHDLDLDGSEAKLQWFFRNEDKLQRFNLGNISLEAAHG